MPDIRIPPEEKRKLFPFSPTSILVPIIVWVITMGILLFDVTGESNTNPVVFYVIPFITALIFLPRSTLPVILDVLGLRFKTIFSKVVAILSLPLGWFLGVLLNRLAVAKVFIFQIATYPWVASTLSTGGVGILATISPTTNFILYSFVAFFEEATSIFMGKSIANWFHLKGARGVLASIGGYILARLLLVSNHWFAYRGFLNPSLYLSATFLFILFTGMGILIGLIIHRFRTGEKLDQIGFLPISLPIMFMMHLAFDFTMSQLSIIPNLILTIIPKISFIFMLLT